MYLQGFVPPRIVKQSRLETSKSELQGVPAATSQLQNSTFLGQQSTSPLTKPNSSLWSSLPDNFADLYSSTTSTVGNGAQTKQRSQFSESIVDFSVNRDHSVERINEAEHAGWKDVPSSGAEENCIEKMFCSVLSEAINQTHLVGRESLTEAHDGEQYSEEHTSEHGKNEVNTDYNPSNTEDNLRCRSLPQPKSKKIKIANKCVEDKDAIYPIVSYFHNDWKTNLETVPCTKALATEESEDAEVDALFALVSDSKPCNAVKKTTRNCSNVYLGEVFEQPDRKAILNKHQTEGAVHQRDCSHMMTIKVSSPAIVEGSRGREKTKHSPQEPEFQSLRNTQGESSHLQSGYDQLYENSSELVSEDYQQTDLNKQRNNSIESHNERQFESQTETNQSPQPENNHGTPGNKQNDYLENFLSDTSDVMNREIKMQVQSEIGEYLGSKSHVSPSSQHNICQSNHEPLVADKQQSIVPELSEFFCDENNACDKQLSNVVKKPGDEGMCHLGTKENESILQRQQDFNQEEICFNICDSEFFDDNSKESLDDVKPCKLVDLSSHCADVMKCNNCEEQDSTKSLVANFEVKTESDVSNFDKETSESQPTNDVRDESFIFTQTTGTSSYDSPPNVNDKHVCLNDSKSTINIQDPQDEMSTIDAMTSGGDIQKLDSRSLEYELACSSQIGTCTSVDTLSFLSECSQNSIPSDNVESQYMEECDSACDSFPGERRDSTVNLTEIDALDKMAKHFTTASNCTVEPIPKMELKKNQKGACVFGSASPRQDELCYAPRQQEIDHRTGMSYSEPVKNLTTMGFLDENLVNDFSHKNEYVHQKQNLPMKNVQNILQCKMEKNISERVENQRVQQKGNSVRMPGEFRCVTDADGFQTYQDVLRNDIVCHQRTVGHIQCSDDCHDEKKHVDLGDQLENCSIVCKEIVENKENETFCLLSCYNDTKPAARRDDNLQSIHEKNMCSLPQFENELCFSEWQRENGQLLSNVVKNNQEDCLFLKTAQELLGNYRSSSQEYSVMTGVSSHLDDNMYLQNKSCSPCPPTEQQNSHQQDYKSNADASLNKLRAKTTRVCPQSSSPVNRNEAVNLVNKQEPSDMIAKVTPPPPPTWATVGGTKEL